MHKTSYTVIGTGAVGGFYGIRLQRAGHDVHFLLHRDCAHVREHGLRLDSVDGDIVLERVQAYGNARSLPRSDVVVVALKSYHNHILADVLPYAVGPDTTVLLLQNGLGGEETVSEAARGTPVLGGLCFLCSNKIGPGHIHHLDYGRVTLGAYRADGRPGGVTPAMERVAADFASLGRPARLVDDLLLARWKKLVWNVPFNGLTVLLNARTDHLMNDPDIRKLAKDLMNEVTTGAASVGRTIEREFVEKMLTDTRNMAPYKPSMKLDYDNGRPMEIEGIYGRPIAIAAANGTAMPKTEALYRALMFLDRRKRTDATER
jgi:2-dehydropantoate 2-reductase